jgi:hypothetical protein
MAGREPSIPRRRVLGAAAALPIAALIPAPLLPAPAHRGLFDRRLARYRRTVGHARAAAETGWFRAANDRHVHDIAAITARFGARDEADSSPEGTALYDAAWARLNEAEDAYWHRCTVPVHKAAVALVMTPARISLLSGQRSRSCARKR